MEDTMQFDPDKLEQLIGRALSDFGAAFHATLATIGDRLGLYRALADAPLSSAELAERTGTAERYIREWLACQAAGGYVTYHPETGRFGLSPEQRLLMVEEDSPAFFAGAFQTAAAASRIEPHLCDAFLSGQGIAWGEHDHSVFHGTERSFRPHYLTHLVSSWIPALHGIEERLRRGAHVADVGCGHGASTIVMARAYPASTFAGFDAHPGSVATARKRARQAGVADRIRFEVTDAQGYDSGPYGLIAMFDALHDMGDPVGAARHAREQLEPGGVLLLVEPLAGDRLEENLNPVGRAFYGASTLMCTPGALAQGGGYVLGAQAGEARLREVVLEAGFRSLRRAAETPMHLVLEARA
jgi:2-polyprenyl-3-methyl-5-hydroxy-6-metoxy-1,4-benzoquinol methylase